MRCRGTLGARETASGAPCSQFAHRRCATLDAAETSWKSYSQTQSWTRPNVMGQAGRVQIPALCPSGSEWTTRSTSGRCPSRAIRTAVAPGSEITSAASVGLARRNSAGVRLETTGCRPPGAAKRPDVGQMARRGRDHSLGVSVMRPFERQEALQRARICRAVGYAARRATGCVGRSVHEAVESRR